MSNKQFTEAERAELDAVSGLMSKSSLETTLRNIKYFNLKDFTVSEFNIDKNSFDGRYYASIYAESKQNGSSLGFYFTLDAQNGRLIEANCYDRFAQNTKAELSAAELEKKSEEIIRTLAADVIGEYERDTDNAKDTVRYTRYVNGIKAEFDTVTVSLNKYTGEPEYYRLSYTDTDFPAISGVIGADTAADKLFDSCGYEKVYIAQTESGTDNTDKHFALVYALGGDTPQTVDALNGNILDYSGDTYTKRVPAEYSDIDGHYAESAVRDMSRYGVSLAGDKFLPDSAITQADFLRLILAVFKYRSFDENTEVSEIYRYARRYNIIKSAEENPSIEVTRETAAVFIVRALGIDEYAQLDGIYLPPFSDVSRNKGAISILAAMNVFRGDNIGNFNPDAPITRGDTMIALNNYLNR